MAESKSIFADSSYADWFSIGLQGVNQMTNAMTSFSNYMSEASRAQLSSQMNEINAERMDLNVDFIQNEYSQKFSSVGRQTEERKGQMREAMSKSGFEVGSGSYVDMETREETLKNEIFASLSTQRDMQLIQNKYQQEMLGIQSRLEATKASVAKKQAKTARTYGMLSGALMTATGGMGAYGKYTGR